MPVADTQIAPNPLAPLRVHDLRLAPRVLHDADVADPHAVREAGAHRLHDGFLGREAHGEEPVSSLSAGKLDLLLRHEQMLDEARAEPLQRLTDTLGLEDIDAD